MKRAALTLVATLALLVLMAFSATAAMACASWEDCPPASTQGQLKSSPTAYEHVQGVVTGANVKAIAAGQVITTKAGEVTGTNTSKK